SRTPGRRGSPAGGPPRRWGASGPPPTSATRACSCCRPSPAGSRGSTSWWMVGCPPTRPTDAFEESVMTGEEIAELLVLEPLPVEGGLIRQTLADGAQTAIYYLVVPPDFSAMHLLPGPEVWHFYGGAPLELLLLH